MKRCVQMGAIWGAMLFGAAAAHAQVIRGRVQDLGTHKPIKGVRVALWNGGDSTIAAQSTGDSGQFLFRLPGAGKYSLDLRHISYVPMTTTPAELELGDTVSVVLEMALNPVMLDTVMTHAPSETRGVFAMTSGQEYVRKHFVSGTGMIVSGAQIELSGKTMSEYLGALRGMHLSGATGSAFSSSVSDNALPTIPAGKGEFLFSDSGSQCLYARVDRFSLLYLLMQNHAMSIDEVVKVKDVMAVEVYWSPRQVPPEWRQDAIATQLFSRQNNGQTYAIGTTGFPAIDTTGFMDPMFGATPLNMDNAIYGTAPLPRQDTAPPCGFVQIWTGAAWPDRGGG
ncbi:MAG TPA: carboxypeptidase-like regulatory domain-containing protein [Gemmatimonadaceae bacterium]|nr:carboxypeptidase-like regulatory domain-containing protein [Gemmatimonadaceae bacterium]